MIEFGVSPSVRPGAQELHTESYYVEIQQGQLRQRWEFRLVDDKVKPVAIALHGQPDAAFSEAWQPIPEAGGVVDTGRGLVFTFASPSAPEEAGRRSGAARTDYVNCCEYPSRVQQKKEVERAGRTYKGPPIETDLSDCRTTSRRVGYVVADFFGANYSAGLGHRQV